MHSQSLLHSTLGMNMMPDLNENSQKSLFTYLTKSCNVYLIIGKPLECLEAHFVKTYNIFALVRTLSTLQVCTTEQKTHCRTATKNNVYSRVVSIPCCLANGIIFEHSHLLHCP